MFFGGAWGDRVPVFDVFWLVSEEADADGFAKDAVKPIEVTDFLAFDTKVVQDCLVFVWRIDKVFFCPDMDSSSACGL